MEHTTFVPCDDATTEGALQQSTGGGTPPVINAEAIQHADALRARQGPPRWMLDLKARQGRMVDNVIDSILRKGCAGHTYRLNAKHMIQGLKSSTKLTDEQATTIQQFLEEARTGDIESAWDRGELTLYDLIRRGVEICGASSTTRLRRLDQMVRKQTGESAWKS